MAERKNTAHVDSDSTAAMPGPPVSGSRTASAPAFDNPRSAPPRSSTEELVANARVSQSRQQQAPMMPSPSRPPPVPQRAAPPVPQRQPPSPRPPAPQAQQHTPVPHSREQQQAQQVQQVQQVQQAPQQLPQQAQQQQPQPQHHRSGPYPAASGPTPLAPRVSLAPSLGPSEELTRPSHVSDFHLSRSRTYAFVLNSQNQPIQIGAGRFGKVFLGEERWLDSLTDVRRPVVIKMLQRNVDTDDAKRFRMEKELLERVQGHPSIVELLASGTIDDPGVPQAIREQCEGDFMILERLDMNLEERIKGSRNPNTKEDLLALDMHDRLLRVLEYMIPVASAVEYAHLVRNVCHRDIKPANVLVGLRDPRLAGSTLQVRLADFNVAKIANGDPQMGVTRFAHGVPGTMYFQSPEQETNVLELLVNVEQGSPEVEYFEDFYINVAKNDAFALFNREREYPVLYTDRARKRIILKSPYLEPTETNIRARVQKSVGRAADIYSLGALFYYLVTGAYGNPKALYDAFHKFVEYERTDESNTVEAYLRHEYDTIESLRSPKTADEKANVAPADRFFSYKHYTDGNGELIDLKVMTVIARCMIRNKPDSYCQAWDLETAGITKMVRELTNLYSLFGFQAGTAPIQLPTRSVGAGKKLALHAQQAQNTIRKLIDAIKMLFAPKRR